MSDIKTNTESELLAIALLELRNINRHLCEILGAEATDQQRGRAAMFARYTAAVRAHERERCARLCDQQAEWLAEDIRSMKP